MKNTALVFIAALVALASTALGQAPAPNPIPTWATGAYADSAFTHSVTIGEHWPPPGVSLLGPVDSSEYYVVPVTILVPTGANPGGYPLRIYVEFPAIPFSSTPSGASALLQCFSEDMRGYFGYHARRIMIYFDRYSGSTPQNEIRQSIEPYDLPPERPVPPCLILNGVPGLNTNSPAYRALTGGCSCGLHSPVPGDDFSDLPTRAELPELWSLYDEYELQFAAISHWWFNQVAYDQDWDNADWFVELEEARQNLFILAHNDFITELIEFYYGS